MTCKSLQEVDVSKCFKHFWQILTILATSWHDPEFQGWHVPSHDPESERVLDRSGCKIIRKGDKGVNPMILHHGSEVWIYGPSSSGQHPWVLPASKHKTSDKLYINMHHIHQCTWSTYIDVILNTITNSIWSIRFKSGGAFRMWVQYQQFLLQPCLSTAVSCFQVQTPLCFAMW